MANVELSDEWNEARGTVELMLGRHSAVLDGNGKPGLVDVVARIQAEDTVVRNRQHRANQRWLLLIGAIPVVIELFKALHWLPR